MKYQPSNTGVKDDSPSNSEGGIELAQIIPIDK